MTVLKISAPPLSARIDSYVLTSTLARLLASGVANSKPELIRASGLARSTVDAGVGQLLKHGVIRQAGYQASTGRGRAAVLLELNPDYGYVLVADCGRYSARLAVVDFRQQEVASQVINLDFAEGAQTVLETLVSGFAALLQDAPHRPLVAVIGVPSPVDYRAGSVIRPPFMPGWDRLPVAKYLSDALGCDVLLENDVNLKALGEARAVDDFVGPLLYVKVGTGIGAGIVGIDGELMRGADGSAGEIAHLKVGNGDLLCVCGNRGCLETVASLGALTRRMLGSEPATPAGKPGRDEFLKRVAQGDVQVLSLVREAARYIGEAVANVVHVLNPHRIVIGGMLAITEDELLATIRGTVYQQALPISTRELMVVAPLLGVGSGIAGGTVLGIEHALAPERLEG